MQRHGVRRLFFASTSAVFGDTRQPLRETTGPLQPVSFYGAAKLAAEAFLSVFAHSFGFRSWVLRFPNVVGERSTHGAVHDFIARLRSDPSRLRVLGNGAQTKPYLYVKDLVDAILLVYDKATEPLAVYHVAGQGMTSVREIAEIVVEEMGLGGHPHRVRGRARPAGSATCPISITTAARSATRLPPPLRFDRRGPHRGSENPGQGVGEPCKSSSSPAARNAHGSAGPGSPQAHGPPGRANPSCNTSSSWPAAAAPTRPSS